MTRETHPLEDTDKKFLSGQVVDLLNPNSYRPLLVRWSKNRGFYVENLFTVQCESIDDLMAVLDEGELRHFCSKEREWYV